MERYQKEKFVRYGVKSKVGGRAKLMFGFVVQKECKSIIELNKTNRTIVKLQLDGENEHVCNN